MAYLAGCIHKIARLTSLRVFPLDSLPVSLGGQGWAGAPGVGSFYLFSTLSCQLASTSTRLESTFLMMQMVPSETDLL